MQVKLYELRKQAQELIANGGTIEKASTGHGMLAVLDELDIDFTNQATLFEIEKAYFSYMFEPVGWDYNKLTKMEKSIMCEQDFKMLVKKYRVASSKDETLKYISDAIKKYGDFHIGALGLEGEPIIGGVGPVMVLANTFYSDYCICETWMSHGDEPLSEEVTVRYEDIEMSYLENVKTAIDRWVEIKSKK